MISVPRHLRPLIVCLITLSAGLSAAGEVYRWTDEQGNVHYGDRPRGAGSEPVTVAPPPARDSRADRRRQRRDKLLKAWEEEQAVERREQDRAETERQQRVQNCRIARRRLEAYRRAGVIYQEQDDGKRRYFSEDERRRVLERARAAVEHWCP